MRTRSPQLTKSSGVVIVDKPQGWTSHQVVGRVRRLAGTRKVGHAGTLDPMATGVLVVGVNRATRLLGHLSLTEKEYRATIRLGQATVTDDADGEFTSTPGASEVTETVVRELLPNFTGDIAQRPSSVSAIKVNGVRSYAKVRAGEEVELAARPVTISRYELLDYRRTESNGVVVIDLDVEVECSSGTYIRALARDLGDLLGVGGHLTALRRTRVGPFDLASATTLDEAATGHEASGGITLIDIAEVARRSFATLIVTTEQADWVRSGRQLPDTVLPAELTAILTEGGEFLALYRPLGADAVAVSVFVGTDG